MFRAHGRSMKKFRDSMELLWDTEITAKNKNPKGTAEGKCPAFIFNHIAHSPMSSYLMYFIPHRCLPAPELIELVKGAFDPSERVVRDLHGKVILNLSPQAIINAFCPPAYQATPILLDPNMRPTPSMNVVNWMKKNSATNFIEFPNTEVPISQFFQHLQLLLSMIRIVMGEESDRFVSPTQLAIAYRLSHPFNPPIFDWSVVISDGITEQLSTIDEGSHFAYVSYIVWLFIHQNPSSFSRLNLRKTDNRGVIRSVDGWTEDVRSSACYYSFVEYFLAPAMALLSKPIPRLSEACKFYLRAPQGETGDWYFVENGTFIRLYGYSSTPFLLPFHVTDWIFSIEYARQLDYIDSKYGTAAKKRQLYPIPHQINNLVLQGRGGSELLKKKLTTLTLKKLNQYWLYDPEDLFSKKMKLQPNPPSFRAERRPEIEQWRNRAENETLMPTAMVTKDLRPPWLSFYEIKEAFDPKKSGISKALIKELKEKKWSEEKITAFNQYRVESGNQFARLETDMDDDFVNMWRLEHPDDVDSSDKDSSDEEEGNKGEEQTQAPEEEVLEVSPPRKAEKVYSAKRKAQSDPQHAQPSKRTKETPPHTGTLSQFSTPVLQSVPVASPVPVISTIPTPVPSSTVMHPPASPISTPILPPPVTSQTPTPPPIITAVRSIPPVSQSSPMASPPPPINPIGNVSPGHAQASPSTPARQIVPVPVQDLSPSSPFITVSGQKVSIDGIMQQYQLIKGDQEAWIDKQLKKIPGPSNPVRLRSFLDSKSKVLEMAVAHEPQEGPGDLTAMNTSIKIDLANVPRQDKNELLHTAVNLNISEVTKLEAKYNKIFKANEALKKQLELQNSKLKAADNQLESLKKTLASAPTADALAQKDTLLTGKDAELAQKEASIAARDQEIASKNAEIALKDTTISNLNANVTQLQQVSQMNKVDKEFLLKIKSKFWESACTDLKVLIQLRDHVDICFDGLNKLKAGVLEKTASCEPLVDDAKRAIEKMNRISDEKLKSLNLGSRLEMLTWINHPIQGKGVCHGIESSLSGWQCKIDSLKKELQNIVSLGIPHLWKENDTPVSDAEITSKIEEVAADSSDVDSLIAAFDEQNMLQFFDKFGRIKAGLQQFLQNYGQISYEVPNLIALAEFQLKDFPDVQGNWHKVQQLINS